MRSAKSKLLLLLGFLLVQNNFSRAIENTNAVAVLWQVKLPDFGNETSPALAPDGTVYQGTFRGWLCAVSPQGKLKWKFKTGTEIRSSPAIAPDGTIYFGSRDRKFYALAPDGKLKWKFTAGAWVDSSPAIAADGTVYFGSWDGNFYAFTPAGELKWQFATSNVITSSPAIANDGTIYFGAHDKNLYALTPDGKLKWKFATGAGIDSSPTINAEGDILFSSTDGNFYALQPDGSELWRLHTGDYYGSSPVLDENGVIYVANNNQYNCISRDGKMLWQVIIDCQISTSFVVTANHLLYLSLPWLRLGCFDQKGTKQWEFPMGFNLGSSPNLDASGVIYAGSGRTLFALKPFTNAVPPAHSPWPMWRANPQHTGRVQAVN
jgi:outer membrane protein assembly factor BamB